MEGPPGLEATTATSIDVVLPRRGAGRLDADRILGESSTRLTKPGHSPVHQPRGAGLQERGHQRAGVFLHFQQLPARAKLRVFVEAPNAARTPRRSMAPH